MSTAPAVNVRELDVISDAEARSTAADAEHLAGLVGIPFRDWGGNCHAISRALLRRP